MTSSLQELDETAYWLELLVEVDFYNGRELKPLQDEAEQLTAIFVASIKTAKSKKSEEFDILHSRIQNYAI